MADELESRYLEMGVGRRRIGRNTVVVVAARPFVDDYTDSNRLRHLLGYIDGLGGGEPVKVQVVSDHTFARLFGGGPGGN